MKHTVTNRNFIKLVVTIFTLAMGFNFVNLLGSYIPIFYIFGGDKVAGARLLGINGTIWAITGVLAVFPLNWISPRLGKRNTLILAMALMCLAQLSKIVCYNPEHPYLVLIPTVLLSSGMLFFFTLGASMVGDICDEDDLATGHRSEGSYYAVFWWFIKMGTALASFVAGVLIVFTMFDETQVTRVDSLQGSIKELRARVQYWKDYQGLVATDASWIEATASERSLALKESKDYVVFLEKESLKKPEGKNKALPAYPEQRKALLLTALTTTRATVNGLEQLQMDLDKAAAQTLTTETPALIEKAISLTLQTKLEKSRIYSFELKSHLDAKAIEVKKSPEHYETLSKNMKEVDDRLALMNPLLSLNVFDEELGNIENKMVLLKKQTPYTLLMMRVVEIGLPLLLSLISIFFILRYSLTEERSHEIKELIRKRNLERQ